jgi:hypothetical protein
MGKTLAAAILAVCSHATASDSATVIRIFDEDLRLPASCTLHARPSVLEQDIRVFCDVVDPRGVVHLYIKPTQECEADIERTEAKVASRTSVGGRELVALSMQLGSRYSHLRLAWDEEVCLIGVSSSEEHLDGLLKSIWK